MSMEELRAKITQKVTEIDPYGEPGSEDRRIYLILIASTFVGHNIQQLVNVTGLPVCEVGWYVRRLESEGIWQGGEWVKLRPDEGDDGLNLGLAAYVAAGRMDYDAASGSLKLTPSGEAFADDLLRR